MLYIHIGKLKNVQHAKGYCKLHKCYLETKDIKERSCNHKNCNHFIELNKKGDKTIYFNFDLENLKEKPKVLDSKI